MPEISAGHHPLFSLPASTPHGGVDCEEFPHMLFSAGQFHRPDLLHRMTEPANLYARVLHQAAQRRAAQKSLLAAQLERIEAKNGNYAQEQRQPTERDQHDPVIAGIVSQHWLR